MFNTTDNSNGIAYCSFCGKASTEVKKRSQGLAYTFVMNVALHKILLMKICNKMHWSAH